MDKFLNSDICNITCSLQHMACFLRQRNLEGHNGNNISQLSTFGELAWKFISAIFESGWDQLTTSDDTPIRDNIMTKFSKVNIPPTKGGDPNNCMVKKVPPLISPCLSKKELEKARITLRNAASKKKTLSLYHTCRPLHPPQISSRLKKLSLSYQTREYLKSTMLYSLC